jgi:hypothetical protein
MKKYFALLLLVTIAGVSAAKAQVIIGGGYGGGYYRPYYPHPRRPVYVQQRKMPPFVPSVYINVGYGFPDLDKNQLGSFQNDYIGNSSTQTGPFLGSIDYRFARFMSIGVMGMYGKVSAPYYGYNTQFATPDFTGTLENWTLMLDLVNYIPVYDTHVEPYFRVAAGINNTISQTYTDAPGSTYNPGPYFDNTNTFAYQLSFGARFRLSPNAGFFLEAGYGKYIGAAGLSFKF